MKSKEQKKENLLSIRDKFGKSNLTVFTTFAAPGGNGGLTVSAISELRRLASDAGGQFIVEKKSLVERVLTESGQDIDLYALPGTLGVMYSYGDGLAEAKAIYIFAKKNSSLAYHSAIYEGSLLSRDRFESLAKLPTREVVLSQMLNMFNHPITGLARVLQRNIRNLAVVLGQIAITK